jgi:hypothetical protein
MYIEQKRDKNSTSALQLQRFQELMEGIRCVTRVHRSLCPILDACGSAVRHRRGSSRLHVGPSSRLYFDKALPLILLYRHEREQYERAKAEALQRPEGGKTFVPSEVYGAEHLLRLFVRLPNLLSQASMSPQEVLQVRRRDTPPAYRCPTGPTGDLAAGTDLRPTPHGCRSRPN